MKKLRVIQRPRCKGWYIRHRVNGIAKWIYLSDNKASGEACQRPSEAEDDEKDRRLQLSS